MRCVWGIWVDGCTVLLTLSTTNSESDESCLEVLRALLKRGRQTPVTITTDGAPGLIKAIDAMWPRSLRMRCWFHKRQNLAQQVPPQAWPAFTALVADMRDAPTFAEGQRRFERLRDAYQGAFPEACRCLADETEASLHKETRARAPARVPLGFDAWLSGQCANSSETSPSGGVQGQACVLPPAPYTSSAGRQLLRASGGSGTLAPPS